MDKVIEYLFLVYFEEEKKNHNSPPEFSQNFFQITFTWIRNCFIAFKSFAFIYTSGKTSLKYRLTYQRLNIFEIWFMGMAAVKILILFPNIYYKEINWLYACFILNSFLAYWLSFTFHIRSCVALQKDTSRARKYQALFGFKIFMLIALYTLSPFFTLDAAKRSGYWKLKGWKDYPILMDCTSIVYRKSPIFSFKYVLANRFCAIFLLDVVSATIDLIIMLKNPSFMNSKQRLKMARQMDIMQTSQNKMQISSHEKPLRIRSVDPQLLM